MTNLLHAKFKRATRSTLCWMILFVLASTIFLILSLLTYFDLLVIPKETSQNPSLQLAIAFIIHVASIIAFFAVSIRYLLDYKLIKRKTYPTVNVIVSRFDFYWSGYEPMERILFPVFVDADSGERVKIFVDEDEKMEVGDRYRVAYLPRTKITILTKIK